MRQPGEVGYPNGTHDSTMEDFLIASQQHVHKRKIHNDQKQAQLVHQMNGMQEGGKCHVSPRQDLELDELIHFLQGSKTLNPFPSSNKASTVLLISLFVFVVILLVLSLRLMAN